MTTTIIETLEPLYVKKIETISDDSEYNKLFAKIQKCKLNDPTNFPSINEYLQVRQYINNKKLNNNK